MSVYQNSQYGVRFSYPSNYTVKYGNAAFGTSNNPLGDSGIGMKNSNLTSLVTIEMPSNSYPNTGFGGAYLNVSVGTQMTSSQCSAMNTAGSSPSSGTKTIGGVPFKWSVDGSAAAGTDFTNGSFSGYTNGMCYVLLAGGVESNGAIGNVASDGAIITAVNQNSILAALNSVLATMTFSAPVNLPPITTTTTTWAAPSINPLNPSSGPLGTMITITGSGFHNGKALMGDSDSVVWISNGSQKGVLASYQPQIDTMTVGIPYSVCQTNNAYSGAPCSSSMVLTPGNYSIYIVNGNGTSNSEPYAVTASASVPPTAYNGTVNVSLDSSTPAAGTVAAGTKNVAFATIKLTATGGNAQMQWFSVVSNSANAVRGLSNIKLFEGSTLLGSAQNLLANPSVPGGYVNVPESIPLIIQNGTSVTLTIMADVAPSANGSIDLGIGGGADAPMSPNYSIYGNNMTVAGASSGMATMLNVSVASNSNLFNGAVPAGTSNVMIGSYAINNPSTEPVTLSQLTLDFGQSTAVLNNVGITLNGGGQIAIVPTLNLSSNDVSPSVTLNSNAVTIPAGGSVTLGVYANIGVSSPSGATETTSVKSCSAQGGISYTAYSCNAVTGYKFMVK
jgi:hypothetical protein